MPNIELATFIDRWTMEYVRFYPHPIERVWRAITDPVELAQWFIRPTKWELKVGAAYRMHDDGFSGKILAVEPPTLLRLGNAASDGGYNEFQLSDAPGGTLMRFVNHFSPEGTYAETPDDLGGDLPGGPGTPWKPGFVGGYHDFWDRLADLLDGVPVGSRLPPTEFRALAESFAKDGLRAGLLDEKGAARLVRQFRGKERWNELNKIYREFIRENCPPLSAGARDAGEMK